MFSNLQIRPAKPHRRKTSMATRAGVGKRRVSQISASASEVPSLSLMEELFGAEFPEAFSTGHGGALQSRKSILDLPAELLAIISEHLAKLDIKRLRLANKYLAINMDLRIERVYVSPNRANLNCLQRILDHPRYKHRVREIVWDDAQLEEYPNLESFRHAVCVDESKVRRDIERVLEKAIQRDHDESAEYRALEHDDFFQGERLTEVAKGILLRINDQFSRDVIARNAFMMSIEESYKSYQTLYGEEQEIMKRGLDDSALRQALAGFTNLHRITLTSEVWRPWNLSPRYDTPFFRSLPAGFRKPSVWPWLGDRPHPPPTQIAHRDVAMSTRSADKYPPELRGYSIIVAALLVMQSPCITEFIIDPANECTGISLQVLNPKTSYFQYTLHMLRHVPLTRFILSFEHHDHLRNHRALYASSIRTLLEQMQHLEHFDFRPNSLLRHVPSSTSGDEWLIPWRLTFPDAMGSRLKTLALRNMYVDYDELVQAIEKLRVVEHITFDNVSVLGTDGFYDRYKTWFAFLHVLKAHYADDHTASKPRITYIAPFVEGPLGTLRCRLVEDEIGEFLYQEGECPFHGEDGLMEPLLGWVVDDRDENFWVSAGDEHRAWFEGWGRVR
jgi:hypothetical protein